MVHQFLHCGIIGDHHSLKSPLLPQNPAQKKSGAGGRNPFHRIERGHHHCRSRLYGLPVGRQVEISQNPPGHIHRIVFPAPLRLPICGKMLYAGGYSSLFPGVLALISPDGGRRDLPVEIRIFTAGFHHPAPAGIPDQIRHGGKSHMQSRSRRFPGHRRRRFLRQIGVKGTSLCQGNGHNGHIPMYHIGHKKQRNLLPGFCQIVLLQFFQERRSQRSQHRPGFPKRLVAELPHPQRAREIGGRQLIEQVRRKLGHLHRLFLQAHIRHQIQYMFSIHVFYTPVGLIWPSFLYNFPVESKMWAV